MNNPWNGPRTDQVHNLSKTDIKRDLYVFLKNDLKETREVKLLEKASKSFMNPAIANDTRFQLDP